MADDAELSRLHREIAELRAEAKRYRTGKREAIEQLSAVTKERDDALGQVKALTTDRDTWKTKAEASPGEASQEVQRLQAELHTRDHRDAWASVRDELADKVTVEKVWAEIGYTPGDKIPTAEQIKERVDKARETVPYLFKVPDGTTTPPGGASGGQGGGGTPPPGPGYGRGAPSKDAGFMVVRRSDAQNPAWMEANQSKLNDAFADNRVKWVD